MTTLQTNLLLQTFYHGKHIMFFFYLARYGQLSGLVEPFAGVLGAALGKIIFF
jgi:hypothetical protein